MATKKAKDTNIPISLTGEQKALLDEALKECEPTEFIETGNVGLDLALTDGKGLPMGSSILLWAKPGCGKTTIVADASKRLIRRAKANGEVFKVLYLAVENSSGLMASLGMTEYEKSGDFLYIPRAFSWRQIETFYEAVLAGYAKYEGVRLIVIDSVNNVLSDQNTKNSVADGDYGTRARERYAFYSKYLPLCGQKGISSIFISQMRQKQNVNNPYEDKNKAAVGSGDLHNVDIILKCTSSTSDTDASQIEEETIFGKDTVRARCIFKMDSKATDCKNRFIKGNCVSLLFEKGKCVWNYYTVKKLLEGNKLMKTHPGGWYTFDPDLCTQFNLPEVKLRREEFNDIVQEHVADFVTLLKKMGKYKVGIKETEVPVPPEAASDDEEEDE